RDLHSFPTRRSSDLWRDEVHPRSEDNVAVGIQYLHRRADLEFSCAVGGDGQIDLKTTSLIERCQHGGVGDPIADMDGDVANDAVHWSENAVVLQLHFLLMDLRVERFHVS